MRKKPYSFLVVESRHKPGVWSRFVATPRYQPHDGRAQNLARYMLTRGAWKPLYIVNVYPKKVPRNVNRYDA